MYMSNKQDSFESQPTTNTGARVWAAVATVAFHLLLLAALLFSFLRYPPKGVETWPPEPEKEIVFDEVEELYASGEFVRTGDTTDELVSDEMAPSAEDQPEPSQDGADLADAGKVGDPKPVVSSQKESPMKVENKPKGPTKEEVAAEKQRQEAAKREQAKKNAQETVKFNGGGGSGNGSAGQPDGNSATGVSVGTAGKGLQGRSLEKWVLPSSSKIGTIAISVKVDSKGNVISATYSPSGSKGTVAADENARRACEQKAKGCHFSVKEGAPTASGTILFTFR